MKQLAEEYKGRVHLVIKFAPYPHRDFAKIASRAALAAREQSKFWQMHEKLLENYRILDFKVLDRLVAELKLDRAKFYKDMDSERIIAAVDADLALCDSIPVYQTPTFFFNGRTVVGAKPIEALRAIADEELSLARKGGK